VENTGTVVTESPWRWQQAVVAGAHSTAQHSTSAHSKRSNDDNNAFQFFIIYVPRKQLQDQLQTQHSVITDNGLQESTEGKS
jgi:hypothetical protein